MILSEGAVMAYKASAGRFGAGTLQGRKRCITIANSRPIVPIAAAKVNHERTP
jgi:hypothetical protein